MVDYKKVNRIKRKQLFMMKLAEEGRYGRYFNVDWDKPSYGELLNADDLVTDEEILREDAKTPFADDFVKGVAV